MENSNKIQLLEDSQTEASYQPSDSALKVSAFSYTVPQQPQLRGLNSLVDYEITSNFKLYKAVIYVYLVIILVQILKSSLDIMVSFALWKLLQVLIYLITFAIWFLGSQAVALRNIKYQIRFQGLLILFMVYYSYVCGRIIVDSYTVMPNLTYSSFGLNAIFGIFIPVLVYYRGDDLRKIMEGNTQRFVV